MTSKEEAAEQAVKKLVKLNHPNTFSPDDLEIIKDFFIEGYDLRDSQSGWVDCKERLPEENKQYNVAFSNGIVSSCHYSLTNGWLYDNRNSITHWQPLPGKPKEI